MNTERWLQFHTAALAILGTWLLGWSQGYLGLPLALTVAACASAAPANIARWLRVNRLVANIAALIAVSWSLRDFLDRNSESQLLAIADMLIYLQIVLLFQEKSYRIYWQLLVLSVLQVVVAAALNLGPQFAVLLAAYMALAISTLCLLCLHGEPRQRSVAKPSAGHDAPAWQALLAPPELVNAGDAERPQLTPGRTFSNQVGLLTAATFCFTVVFFYVTPRLGDGAWLGTRGGGSSITGFSSDLKLDEFGSVQQSNQLVMRVRLSRLIDRRPYPVIDDPYFHGVVLTDYHSGPMGNRWIAPGSPRVGWRPPTKHVNQPGSILSLVRQEIAMENSHSPVLFAIMPMQMLTETPNDLKYLSVAHRLVRLDHDEGAPPREFRYAAGTVAFQNGRQLRAIPHNNAMQTIRDSDLLTEELQARSHFDPEAFPHLTELAERILAEQNLIDGPRLSQALALQNHFRTPGLYKYSLDLNFVRHSELDPVEDFVAHHRTGHCEYYASALALMLRSRGIPSRIVTGYKGGEFNSLGSFFQVRQKHAHSWVEAYLDAADVPAEEIAGTPSRGGAWYRLDATPMASRPIGMAEDASLTNRVGDAFDYVDLLWRDYVLGLNATRQKDAFFDPLTSRTAGSLPSWMEANRVQAALLRAAGRTERSRRTNRTTYELAWGAGALVGLVLLMAIVGGRGLWLVARRLALPGWTARRRTSGTGGRSDYYRRLEAILARRKLRRAVGQTPLEFAASAAETFDIEAAASSQSTADALRLPLLPQRIVAAYYRVRFGGALLAPFEVDAIETALAELNAATNKPQT